MQVEDLAELFNSYEDEFLKFDRIQKPLSSRPDIHAFILLNEIYPNTRDMVSAAEHDIIYLDVSLEDLADKITPEQVCDLVRCGVMIEDEEYLAMFV